MTTYGEKAIVAALLTLAYSVLGAAAIERGRFTVDSEGSITGVYNNFWKALEAGSASSAPREMVK